MARKQLDIVLVVDVEATCWRGAPPAGQENEIIEIGICPLDTRLREIGEPRGILVRPTRSAVSPFCTELTGITPEEVETGIPFAEACSLVSREFGAKQRVWASYGDYDRRQFERQCAAFGCGYPFGPTHLNVKTFAALTLGLPHEEGMAETLARLNLLLEGRHHRAPDDARNIATILAHILWGR